MDDSDTELNKWNEEISRPFIPNNIVLILCLVLGISGNLLVIIVYKLRLKGKAEDRYFIPYLAFVDLFACGLGVTANLIHNTIHVNFKSDVLCKLCWYFPFTAQIMSVSMLVIIAIQRYLKICKPLGKQMTMKMKRMTLVLIFVVAPVLAGPLLLFNESVSVYDETRNLTSYRCNTSENYTQESLVYNGIVLSVMALAITLLISVYTRIGYTLYKHFKRQSIMKRSGRRRSEEESKSTTESPAISLGNTEVSNTKSGIDACGSTVIQTENEVSVEAKIANVHHNHKLTDHNRRIMRKFTFMFMLITGVYLLCYIPVGILMLLEALNHSFWADLTDESRAVVRMIFALYIINNIANPFIYAAMDMVFREELIGMLCKCRKMSSFP